MLPRAADLLATDDLEGLKRLVGIPAPVCAGFIQQVGDPGTNVQHLASVPAFVVAQACASTLHRWDWSGELQGRQSS